MSFCIWPSHKWEHEEIATLRSLLYNFSLGRINVKCLLQKQNKFDLSFIYFINLFPIFNSSNFSGPRKILLYENCLLSYQISIIVAMKTEGDFSSEEGLTNSAGWASQPLFCNTHMYVLIVVSNWEVTTMLAIHY